MPRLTSVFGTAAVVGLCACGGGDRARSGDAGGPATLAAGAANAAGSAGSAPENAAGVGGTGPEEAGGTDAGGQSAAGSSSPPGGASPGGTDSLGSASVAYRVNPPDPCFDQMYISDCKDGLSRTCAARLGGLGCSVANVCEDDASKIGLPVTFACPRDLLFSREMVQAAKDDATAYDWSTPADPPFNYAVVGHDAGELDTGLPDTCCQCYQLVLGRPLDNAPQPPLVPNPKPLVVQAFNASAAGGKSFDVYLALGGYGTLNGCYDDPDFAGTKRTYGVFPYTDFPDSTTVSGGAGMFFYEGGLSFNNLSVCQSAAQPPTADEVMSDACQDQIADLCDQVTAPSAAATESSRNSCIQSNQVESLYHQPWQEVWAKRVECPESLTRVTGCRLKSQGLSMADPNVRTPDDAAADPSFSGGYSTTTMQDCCRPTCSWSSSVRSPVEGGWRSTYSCDANGEPRVTP